MTQTLAENTNNDLYLNASGSLALLSAVPAVAQLTVSRVESQQGEMIYAMDEGMPTQATVWDTFNPAQFEAAARAIIEATPDVTGVQSFEMTKTGNELGYTAQITTDYDASGILTISGTTGI